jgi:hypothetical protein
MERTQKNAVVVAVVGTLLIAAAGFLTARDYLQNSSGPCPPAAPVASVPAVPTILDVRSGKARDHAVIRLRQTVCVTVAGVRASPVLSVLRADAEAAGRELVSTAQQLKAARSKGDAARVTELTAELKARNNRLTEAQNAVSAATQDIELVLYLNGRETPARVKAAGLPEPQSLQFELEPADDAGTAEAGSWRRLLGGIPSGGTRDVVAGVGVPGASRPIAVWSPPKPVELQVFSPLIALVAGAGFVLLLVAIFIHGRTSTLLRDGDVNSAYSLGRVQMAFWMIATVFGFVFIWVLTGQVRNVITSASFTLLGVTGATALASRVIDGNARAVRSKGFLTDILSDGKQYPQLHRIQVAIWTVVLGAIFIWNILDALILTNFDSNLLILVGIANGVYAGFKTQEK